MNTQSFTHYALGIDLGTNSIGWAVVQLDGETPSRLADCGTRTFDAGVEGSVDQIARGTDEPRNLARRQARQQRRQTWRRQRRRHKLFIQLQNAGLLPPGDSSTSEKRHELLQSLDGEIKRIAAPLDNVPALEQVLPYWLRAAALRRRLEPFQLGRALYHLGQRRGFQSNRLSGVTDEEQKEEGKVEAGIQDLRSEMSVSDALTIGEHFARLDPLDPKQRIRRRWTHRSMFEEEFERIWQAQAPFHPEVLTAELKRELHHTLFYQRPLKSLRGTIGNCEFEPSRKRAPLALLQAQRFRYLQKLNDLRIPQEDGGDRLLSDFPDLRRALIEELERKEEVPIGRIKKILGVAPDVELNLERGGEKKLKGNVTAARIRKVIGRHGWGGRSWDELNEQERESIVEDLRSIQKPETLARRAQRVGKLDEKTASKFTKIRLESGYCALSRQALTRIVPLLERGMSYATACKQVYEDKFRPSTPHERLPPVRAVLGEVRNPAVERSLSELRKVVNHIVAKYGKPGQIHVELARDLRRPRKERQVLTTRMRRIEKEREETRQKIHAETGDPQPSFHDILKVRLAEECNWECPYTGQSIGMKALIGPEARFDVEHIIPLDRCFDDSIANKTLCLADENRHGKGNRTPWEAYGANKDRWEEILARVKRFRGPLGREKLRRFQLRGEELDEYLQGFTGRQLNDTRYASRLAARYLGLLYGGDVDATGKRKVFASNGTVTAHIRSAYGLNAVLRDGPTSNGGETLKQRSDHRHHAVDAVVIALATPAMVKRLSDAAGRARAAGRRLFAAAEPPWSDFVASVRGVVDRVVVSHRVRRAVRGALHDETLLSKPILIQSADGRSETVHRARKRIRDFKTSGDVAQIADAAIRRIVEERIAQHDGDLKKALGDENDPPTLPNRNGRPVPIYSVRLNKPGGVTTIGRGPTERRVFLGANHHVEVVGVLDECGRETRWEAEMVSLYEAHQRLRRKEPVVKRDHGPGKRFKFSLCGGETIRLAEPDGLNGLFQVRAISQEAPKNNRRPSVKVEFVHVNDARKKDGEGGIKKSGQWYTRSPDRLGRMNCEKVSVSPIGEVTPCHD